MEALKPMPAADLTIIEQYAEQLLRRASALVRGAVVFGAVLGAGLGAAPLTSLAVGPIPHRFGYATLLLGAALGALIGYVVGDARAFNLRVQAQLALHQLQLERTTVAAAEAANAAVQRLAAAPAAQPVPVHSVPLLTPVGPRAVAPPPPPLSA